MYSEQDLRDAVAAGAITDDAATALRAHVAQLRQMPITDEENFRLINSFNDIFVTIAAILLLVAMGGIGSAIVPGLAGLLIAAAAWVMSEFFTRRRRMALPSIVLMLAFVGGVVAAPIEILSETGIDENERLVAGADRGQLRGWRSGCMGSLETLHGADYRRCHLRHGRRGFRRHRRQRHRPPQWPIPKL